MAFGLSKFIGGIRFGVSMDTKKLNRDTKKARMMLKGFVGQSVRMLGIYGGAAGVVAVIGKAASSYEQLNRSMNRSLAIMGDVSKSMRKDMTSAAIEVSRVTNASAKEAADAYFFLASAGLDAKQSLQALPKVAKFAQAGNFNLALATDLLTDAQSALGLTVKDTTKNVENMTRVSDTLIKANTLANATAQQFSEALTNKAGAALRLLGKDVEEGVAVLAAFADQGIKGAEAGTGFGIVLRDLQTKAIKFSRAFKEAGVRVFDASGEMRNMADIIGDLERRMIGLSDKSKKNFLLGLGFSDKSVAFVQALVGVSDKVREYEKALRGAGGATDSVAGKQLTNLEKATNKLAASFDKLSQGLAPAVDLMAILADDVTQVMNVFGSFGRPDEKFSTPKGRFSRGLDEFIRGLKLTDSRGANTTFLDFLKTGGASMIRDVGPRGFAAQDTARQQPFRTPESFAKANAEAVVTTLVNDLPRALRAAVNRGSSLLSDAKGGFQAAQGAFNAKQELGRDIGSFISRLVPNAINGIQAKTGEGLLAFQLLKRQIAIAQGGAMNNQTASLSQGRGQLSFAQSGSAESFRQRAAIRNQKDELKIQKQQLKKLTEIASNGMNGVTLAPAGLA